MKQIELIFNQLAYEVKVNLLKLNITKLTNCLNAIEVITGKKELCTLAEVEQFICDKTTFKNILLSATLLEVSDEYKYLEANLNKINHDVSNVPFTKINVLNQIKRANSTYLKYNCEEESNF